MTSPHHSDAGKLLADQLATASPDLLRGLLSTFIQALMSAEADAVCGAGYGERNVSRSNSRNGYRHRDFDTRRMERLVESLGVTGLSKSQVSVMAAALDEQVEAFRTRPLDAGPYTFVAADALVLKVRENAVSSECIP